MVENRQLRNNVAVNLVKKKQKQQHLQRPLIVGSVYKSNYLISILKVTRFPV